MGGKSKGIIKFFDNRKGYGFISSESGQDVFFHYNELVMSGYKSCRNGDGVHYNEIVTNKGLQAAEIEVYESNWPFKQDYSFKKSSAYQ